MIRNDKFLLLDVALEKHMLSFEMKKMILAHLVPLCAAALLLGCATANAQSVVYMPIQTQTFTGLGGSSTATGLNFNSFNSSLGTLTSVQVILQNVTLSGSAFGTNTSNVGLPAGDTNGPEDFLLNLKGTLTVSSASGINLVLNATDTANNSQSNVAVGATTSTFTYTNVASTPSSANQTATSGLGSYVGNGVTQVTVNVTPSHFGVAGQAYASAGSTANYISANYNGGATASGEVEVIYTYTPVPEPKEAALLLIVFALAIIVVRKSGQNRETPQLV